MKFPLISSSGFVITIMFLKPQECCFIMYEMAEQDKRPALLIIIIAVDAFKFYFFSLVSFKPM